MPCHCFSCCNVQCCGWLIVTQQLSPVVCLSGAVCVCVHVQADVYGFDAGSGTRLYAWKSLAQQSLVDMTFLATQQQLVTASREPTVVVSVADSARRERVLAS